MSPRLDDAAGWLAAAHAHLTAALPGDGDEAARLLCRHASELRGAIDGVLARPADAAGLRAVLLGFDVVRHLRLAIERPLAGDAAAEAGDAAEPPWAGALARFYGCPELDRRLAIYAADVAAAATDVEAIRSAADVRAQLGAKGVFLDAAGRVALAAIDDVLATSTAALDAAIAARQPRDLFVALARAMVAARRRRALVGSPPPLTGSERRAAARLFDDARSALRASAPVASPPSGPAVIRIEDALGAFAAAVASLDVTVAGVEPGAGRQLLRLRVGGVDAGDVHVVVGAGVARSHTIGHGGGVAVVWCNFDGGGGAAARLTLQDVYSLFHELGHALQHALLRSPYANLGGLAAVAPVRRELASYLAEAWSREPGCRARLAAASDLGGEGRLAALDREAAAKTAALRAGVARAVLVARCELAIAELDEVTPASLIQRVDAVTRTAGGDLGDFVDHADAGMVHGEGLVAYMLGRLGGAQLATELAALAGAAPAAARDAYVRFLTDAGTVARLRATAWLERHPDGGSVS